MLQASQLGLINVSGEPGDADWAALKAFGRKIDLYLVRCEEGVWRIVHEGHRAGAYVSAEAAISYACRLARDGAGLGYPSAVLKAGAPRVFRGFTPKARSGE